jgi:hypothetical protein
MCQTACSTWKIGARSPGPVQSTKRGILDRVSDKFRTADTQLLTLTPQTLTGNLSTYSREPAVWCGVISQRRVPEGLLESKQVHDTTYYPDLFIFEGVQLLVLVCISSY